MTTMPNNDSGKTRSPPSSTTTGIQYALIAGVAASGGSVFGKLMSQSSVYGPVIRTLFLLGNLLCTVLMIGMFTRSMQHLSTTTATIINSCSNFLFTALFGYALFGEQLGYYWSMGAVILSVGIAIILSGESDAVAPSPSNASSVVTRTTSTTEEEAIDKKNQ